MNLPTSPVELFQLPAPLRTLIENELRDREQITWISRPVASRASANANSLFIFGIPWTGITVSSIVFMLLHADWNSLSEAVVVTLFAIPFVHCGLWMLSGPSRERRAYLQSACVITDRRLINLQREKFYRITSYAPQQLTIQRRVQHRDGSGDLTFETPAPTDSKEIDSFPVTQIENLPDVKLVEDRIRALVKSAREPDVPMHNPSVDMSIIENLPAHTRKIALDEIRPGEAITWLGQPLPEQFALRYKIAFLIGIPWTLISLFALADTLDFQLPRFNRLEDLSLLISIPFILIGLLLLSIPIWQYREAKRTVYILTNERAITIDGPISTTITSYYPHQLQYLVRTQRPSGSGDLILFRIVTHDSDGDPKTEEKGFFDIPNVKEVEERVRELAAQSPPG